MKVALVHDYIKEYGGAERVLEALHELYPDAPVFTSVYLPKFLGPHRERFKDWNIKTSWLQYVPFKHKLISPFRIISPFVFRQFDLSGFDVILVSATGAYFPNAVTTKKKSPQPPFKKGEQKQSDLKGAVHICYCHTPPRYLYGYATARDWKKHRTIAVLTSIANHFLRMTDYSASKNVDYYIANSEEVAGRIRKFYRRESKVIYPPVDNGISNFQFQISNFKKRTYYLTGGRLARAKHVGLIVEACSVLGVPLKIFGRGFAGYEEELKKELRNNPPAGGQGSRIELIGEVSDEEKWELMAGARAFLFASEDEDFGIIPVEAMAAGTTVIAYKSGGVKETVIDGKTGVFFEELNAESLKKAILQFESLKIKSEKCIKRAEMFSKEQFIKNIKHYIEFALKK